MMKRETLLEWRRPIGKMDWHGLDANQTKQLIDSHLEALNELEYIHKMTQSESIMANVNHRQIDALEVAAAHLDLLGRAKLSGQVRRVIDEVVEASDAYKEAADFDLSAPVSYRQAFGHWYARSGRKDLEQCWQEFQVRSVKQ